MKKTVHYDYHDGQLVPIWAIIHFEPAEIDWDSTWYIPVETPFEKQEMDAYSDEMMGVSVLISDLVVSYGYSNHYGIHLPYIKERIEKHSADIMDVKQFVIQVSDIEELLHMKVYRA